jgi:hypothetical protein
MEPSWPFLPQTSRLRRLQRELNNLDAEIDGLHEDLATPDESLLHSSSSSDSFAPPPSMKNQSPYRGTANRGRLFAQSVAVLERRSHQMDSRSDDQSNLALPRRQIRIPGYRPPSERVTESADRKRLFVDELRVRQEQQFREEYTFQPQINPESRQLNYDPSHLIQRRVPSDAPRDEVRRGSAMDPKSVQIAAKIQEKGDSFLRRQLHQKTRSQSVQKLSPIRKLTKSEAILIAERLSKPRPRLSPRRDAPATPTRKLSDARAAERLVRTGIRKDVVAPDPPKFESLMDSRSRLLARSATSDLFKESLDRQERQRRRAEEVKQWQELAEVTTFTSQRSATNRRPISMPKKCSVAGMDDFLERMSRRQRQQQEPKTPVRASAGAIIATPFSFENRPRKTRQMIARDVETVLSEINILLAD